MSTKGFAQIPWYDWAIFLGVIPNVTANDPPPISSGFIYLLILCAFRASSDLKKRFRKTAGKRFVFHMSAPQTFDAATGKEVFFAYVIDRLILQQTTACDGLTASPS